MIERRSIENAGIDARRLRVKKAGLPPSFREENLNLRSGKLNSYLPVFGTESRLKR